MTASAEVATTGAAAVTGRGSGNTTNAPRSLRCGFRGFNLYGSGGGGGSDGGPWRTACAQAGGSRSSEAHSTTNASAPSPSGVTHPVGFMMAATLLDTRHRPTAHTGDAAFRLPMNRRPRRT